MYAILVALHVLAAVALLGPAFASPFLIAQMRRQPEAIPAVGPIMARISKLPKYGGLFQLVTGLVLIGMSDWAILARPWAYLSVIGVLVAAVISVTQLEPRGKQLGMMAASGKLDPAKVNEITHAMQRFAGINLSILTVIVLLMVFRP